MFKKPGEYFSEGPMFEKLGITKENRVKLIAALIVASVTMLAISVLTEDFDGRKQVTSGPGEREEALCGILSEVKGVGEVNVMIEYRDRDKNTVSGVIVIAGGAGDPATKRDIIKGVAALFDIPASSVMVFEKKEVKEK